MKRCYFSIIDILLLLYQYELYFVFLHFQFRFIVFAVLTLKLWNSYTLELPPHWCYLNLF